MSWQKNSAPPEAMHAAEQSVTGPKMLKNEPIRQREGGELSQT
jgi:hypothetical protein